MANDSPGNIFNYSYFIIFSVIIICENKENRKASLKIIIKENFKCA